MTLVHLVSRIFAPEPAAASFRLEALVNALAKCGTDVQVTTTLPAPGTENYQRARCEKNPRVSVRRYQARRDESGYVRGYLPYMSFDIPSFFRLLREEKPDVYVCEPPPTTGLMVRFLAWLRRRPYVFYAADVWSDAAKSTGAPGLVVKVVRAMERMVYKGAAGVIAVSPGVAQRVRELGGGNVTVVLNGIDTEVFTAAGEAPAVIPGFTRREGPLFVYAGTTSEWQGAEVFIQAFAEVIREYPQAQLLFLGQGSAWEDLQDLALVLPPGSVGFGRAPQAQAAAWQRAATATLVSIKPGLGYDYAYPTKALAAWACDTPVIYAGPGPVRRDTIENHLGWAVDWAVPAVAEAMREAITQPRPQGMREWVVANRSLNATGAAAAKCVLGAAK